MCLAVPGRVVEIDDDTGTRMATVDFDGIRKEVCLAYLPEVAVGEYVIVHVGFAISKVDEASARETLAQFQDLGVLEESLGAEPPPYPEPPPRPEPEPGLRSELAPRPEPAGGRRGAAVAS